MSLIAHRDALIIDSVARENPLLPVTPTIHNCWVWHYRHEDDLNGWCYIRGRAGSGLAGKRQVKYQKLDIAVLLQGCLLLVPRLDTRSAGTYVSQINKLFGLDLLPTDVVNNVIESTDTHFTLEILPTHTLYRGKVEFSIGVHTDRLASLVTARDLEVVIDTYQSWVAMPPAVLTMGHDYSSVGDALSAYNRDFYVSDTRVQALVALLNSVDRVPWSTVASTLYSLVDATVVYNGDTPLVDSVYAPLVNTDYAQVLVIQPQANSQTKFGLGPLVFHYNLYAAARS